MSEAAILSKDTLVQVTIPGCAPVSGKVVRYSRRSDKYEVEAVEKTYSPLLGYDVVNSYVVPSEFVTRA